MRFVVASAVVIALIGCDPGIHLAPIGWRPYEAYRWDTEHAGVRFEISGIGGTIGTTYLAPEITVTNTTAQRFVIDSATLEANGRTFEASFMVDGEEKWRSAGPGTTERITLFWKFDDPIQEIVGTSAFIDLSFRLGAEPHTMRVEFKR